MEVEAAPFIEAMMASPSPSPDPPSSSSHSNPPIIAPVLETAPECPVCNKKLPGMTDHQISNHIDECLTKSFLEEDPMLTNTTSAPAFQQTQRAESVVVEPTIICPYYNCGRTMTVLEFAYHAVSTHQTHAQNVFCPICKLLGEDTHVNVNKLHLWAHLNSDHADIMSIAIVDQTNNPPPFPPPVRIPPRTQNPSVLKPTEFRQRQQDLQQHLQRRFPPPPPPPQPQQYNTFTSNNNSNPFRNTKPFVFGEIPSWRDLEESDEENQWSEEEDESGDDEPPFPVTNQQNNSAINRKYFNNYNNFLREQQTTVRHRGPRNNNTTSNNSGTSGSGNNNPGFPFAMLPPPPPPPFPSVAPPPIPPTTISTTTITSTTTMTTTTTTTSSEDHFTLPTVISANYMAYTLQGGLPDKECLICFDDFVEGQQVARVECMCIFHEYCIAKWYARRKCCPFHMTNSEDE